MVLPKKPTKEESIIEKVLNPKESPPKLREYNRWMRADITCNNKIVFQIRIRVYVMAFNLVEAEEKMVKNLPALIDQALISGYQITNPRFQ